ncbi:hypothetical protein QLX08_004459 [Tetragonisca angustula]|uniref:Uncharacterized protein n=1 Tax=Tetragonisca angustula TaxID=166442 RepID=A0AAW1A502_9HYME
MIMESGSLKTEIVPFEEIWSLRWNENPSLYDIRRHTVLFLPIRMNLTFPSIEEYPLWETEKEGEGIMAAIYLDDFCGGNYGASTRSYNSASEQETTCREIASKISLVLTLNIDSYTTYNV